MDSHNGIGCCAGCFWFLWFAYGGALFLFCFGLLALPVWLVALQALALFSYWSFGVAVLAVCQRRWPCLAFGLFVLAFLLFALGVGLSLFSCRYICTAPVRGGTYFSLPPQRKVGKRKRAHTASF
jgi:hypothetical protein